MATDREKLDIQEKLIREMSELIKIQREAIEIMGRELEKGGTDAQSNIQHDRTVDNVNPPSVG